jgi:polysaccharide export outer membrane protein
LIFAILAVAAAPFGAAMAATPPAGFASTLEAPASDYRIGPTDKLDIIVFQVKDLSLDNVQVDAGGRILLPLIGLVPASGRTTTELSDDIAARLAGRYLQSPRVSVMVAEALSQKISVEGAVNEAGVFPLKGRTSLLEAIAMAKGVGKGANLHRVAILRAVDGVTRSATFDFAAIRAGAARNPEVLANDVVIVADSKTKGFWRGVVETLPALVWFTYL